MRTRTFLLLVVLAALCAAPPSFAEDKFSGGPPGFALPQKVRSAVTEIGHDTWVGAYSSAYAAAGAYSDTLVIRRDLNHNGNQAGTEIIPISSIQLIFRGAGGTNADSLRLRIHNTYSATDTSIITVSMNIYNQVLTIPVRCAYVCIRARKSSAAARDFLCLGLGER